MIYLKQCKSLNDCFKFLVEVAQSYCKNNTNEASLQNYGKQALNYFADKVLKKSHKELFTKILRSLAIYNQQGIIKALKKVAQDSAKNEKYETASRAYHYLYEYQDTFGIDHMGLSNMKFSQLEVDDGSLGFASLQDVSIASPQFLSVVDVFIRMKFALVNHTSDISKIIKGSKKYSTNFKIALHKYSKNHSETLMNIKFMLNMLDDASKKSKKE